MGRRSTSSWPRVSSSTLPTRSHGSLPRSPTCSLLPANSSPHTSTLIIAGRIYDWPYSNIQSSEEFRAALAEHFLVERQLPTAYNWNHSEPGRWYVRGSNLYLNIRIPFFTRWLGVEYLYICRPRIRGN